MTKSYLKNRAREILDNKLCLRLVMAILNCNYSDTLFFVQNERQYVTKQIEDYLTAS